MFRQLFHISSVLNVKVLVGAFNQEKALQGAFSVIVKSSFEAIQSYTQTGLSKLASMFAKWRMESWNVCK